MNDEIKLDLFRRIDVLNIFCDASTLKHKGIDYSCHGAVAVLGDRIIDSDYIINKNSTSCNGEARAVCAGIHLALKYYKDIPVINIFSDSQITIFGIRDRFDKWKCINGVYYTKDNKEKHLSKLRHNILCIVKVIL